MPVGRVRSAFWISTVWHLLLHQRMPDVLRREARLEEELGHLRDEQAAESKSILYSAEHFGGITRFRPRSRKERRKMLGGNEKRAILLPVAFGHARTCNVSIT